MSGYLSRLSGDIRRDAPEPARGFAHALAAGPNVAVIAEVKRGSPSQGPIRPDADVVATAEAYELGGATCLSVLCAERDFGGSVDDLAAARRAVSIPAIAKDFTVFPEQVARQRLAGADAILVILAMVTDDEARRLMATAALLGMDTLVEVHTAEEAERAVLLEAPLVGVNARDLQTLEIDRDRQLGTASRAAGGPDPGGGVGHRRPPGRDRGPRRRRRRGAGRHRPDARPGTAGRPGGGGARVSTPLVKICGLTRETDVEAAVEAGADLVGFVIAVDSLPRRLAGARRTSGPAWPAMRERWVVYAGTVGRPAGRASTRWPRCTACRRQPPGHDRRLSRPAARRAPRKRGSPVPARPGSGAPISEPASGLRDHWRRAGYRCAQPVSGRAASTPTTWSEAVARGPGRGAVDYGPAASESRARDQGPRADSRRVHRGRQGRDAAA